MRGAGEQVETSVVNGAKEMLQSAFRDNVLGATKGFLVCGGQLWDRERRLMDVS